MQAMASKKPAITLLNGILSCVFTDEEMEGSCGLGLRGSDLNMLPLDSTKLDAVIGKKSLRMSCKPTLSHMCKVFLWN